MCVCVCVRVAVCGGGDVQVHSVSAGYVSHEKEVQLISLHTLEASVVSDKAFAPESNFKASQSLQHYINHRLLSI